MTEVQARPRQGLAVAGFVCGLVGLLLCWIPLFGWPLPILGVVFGAVGWKHGLGKAGLILGSVAIVLGLVVFLAIVANSA